MLNTQLSIETSIQLVGPSVFVRFITKGGGKNDERDTE